MLKKPFLLAILFIFVFLASGCTLIKGAGGAAVGFGQGAAAGAEEGFNNDVNFIKKTDNWAAGVDGWVKEADSWIKDNLW